MNLGDEKVGRLAEIERIYRSRLPELWRVAAAVSGPREAAPDLVQEAFVRGVRRVDGFRGDGPLEGWLWRIVVNVARNARREPVTAALPEELLVADTSSVGAAQADVAAAVSMLSERQRLVLFLHYYADLDYRAIGEALSISSGTVGATVGATLTTARAAIAQRLEVKEATS